MGWVYGFVVRRFLATAGTVLALTLSGAGLATVPASALAPTVARSADAGGGTAEISGRIVVPGPATAEAGVTVTLSGVPTSGDPITRTAVTKADATFTFRNLAGGDWNYTITAPYKGSTFSTDLVTVPAGQGLTLKLPVFTPTDSPAKIKTSSWLVWLDVTGDKVAVEQDLSYTNTGSTAYIGTTPVTGATPGAKAAALLSIAPGATNFQYLGRFEACCSAVTNGAWAHTRPIDPGGSSGTLRYESPRPATLAFLAQFPADSITLLAPKGTAVSSPQLTSSGTTTDKNVTYDVYKSGAVKAGDTITVTLSAAAVESSSTPWWIIALIGLLVVVVAGLVVAFVRRRRSAASADTTAAPKVAKAPAPTRPVAAPKPAKAAAAKPEKAATSPAAPRSEAEVLAEQLAQLDLKYENGEFSDDAAYRRVRESLVQQLVDAVATDPTSLS